MLRKPFVITVMSSDTEYRKQFIKGIDKRLRKTREMYYVQIIHPRLLLRMSGQDISRTAQCRMVQSYGKDHTKMH